MPTLAAFVLCLPQAAPVPQLVADLNLAPAPDVQIFKIRGTALGRLWIQARLTGLPNGTWTFDPAVGQIQPFGPLQTIGRATDNADDVVQLDPNRALLVTTPLGVQGSTLWAYDGSTDTVEELWSQPNSARVLDLVVRAGTGYFWTSDNRIWSTDGSVPGTRLLEDLTGAGDMRTSVYGEYLHTISNGVLFLLDTGDQTEFRRIANPFVPSFTLFQVPDTEFGGLSNWRASGDLFYFPRATAAAGLEPWTTDGTTIGTQLLSDIEPGPASSSPRLGAPTAGGLYFAATTSNNGSELWFSDGSANGTRLFAEPVVGPTSSLKFFNRVVGTPTGAVFFADTAALGTELWTSDGTPAGTQVVADLAPGPGTQNSTAPNGPATSAGGLVAMLLQIGPADDKAIVLNTNTGTFSLFPQEFMNFTADSWGLLGGEAYLDNGFSGKLWSADGIVPLAQPLEGALQLSDSNGSNPRFLASDLAPLGPLPGLPGSRFALLSAELDGSPELVATDGTALGTQVLGAPAPLNALRFGERFVFRGPDPSGAALQGANEPWITDGTPAGTQLLADLEPGPGGSGTLLSQLQGGEVGNRLVFAANTSVEGAEPWVTDGSSAGTQLLVAGQPGPASSAPVFGDVLNGRLLFGTSRAVATPAGSVTEGRLWSTDGTPTGTTSVLDLPGRVFEFSRAVDGLAYFLAEDPGVGSNAPTLWRTDGSAAGTQPSSAFAPALPGLAGATETTLIALSHRLIVVDRKTAISLDSLGGVTPLLAVNDLRVLAVAGRFAYLGEITASASLSVWRTDGIQAPVIVLNGALPILRAVGSDGTVIGSLFTGEGGQEPFSIDGATGQIQSLPEVLPGPLGSAVSFMGAQRIGNRLLIGLDDGVVGTELFAYDIAALGSYVAEPFGIGCSISGEARLGFEGEARLGAAVSIELDGVAPTAPALLYVGAEPAALPLGSCTVGMTRLLPLVGSVSTAAGATSWPFQLSANPFWLGQALYLQAAAVAPGGPALGQFEVSNALEIVFGS